jgi:hypothetical protein
MQVKQALDAYFADVKFDTALYKRLMLGNIEYITRNQEHTQLFSGRNVGCYFIKYTQYDKNIFYNNLFDLDFDDIVEAIDAVTSIPKNFKIARDDVNLMCFYIAHRFLSNPDLNDKQRREYAKEALNYFSYRTLVLITSTYFVYPISEDKATSMTERLSHKYIIKKLKNWNEYCQYRSDEYLDSKYFSLLEKLDDDEALPNAITDLFGRTKDTIKNIYSEFMEMLEGGDAIKSKHSVVKDGDGNEKIADRVDSVQKYIGQVDVMLSDKTAMIRKDHINVVVDILSNLSYRDLHECLDHLFEFAFSDRKSYDRVQSHMKDILVNAVEYLQRNEVYLHNKTSVLEIMNAIVGNVLYARGTEVDVHRVKNEGEQLIKAVYKYRKDHLSDRTLKSVRNGLYLYVVLMAFTA